MRTTNLGLILAVVCLSVSSCCRVATSSSTETSPPAKVEGKWSGQATASNQTMLCSFSAQVLKLTPINKPLPPRSHLKGYLIHTNPKWALELKVHPHSKKTPFQPGLRRCYIADVEAVFGVTQDQIRFNEDYNFTFIWNVGVPGKLEFERFSATKE